MKIYVASSWRNELQEPIVAELRDNGHEVYDFKKPDSGGYKRPNGAVPLGGFSWSYIDEKWNNWNLSEYLQALESPRATLGFNYDFEAMEWADVCVLVLPCGRSAHLEAGWFIGKGQPVLILIPDGVPVEAELMYRMATGIYGRMGELLKRLSEIQADQPYNQPGCTWRYCPHPDICKAGGCVLQ